MIVQGLKATQDVRDLLAVELEKVRPDALAALGVLHKVADARVWSCMSPEERGGVLTLLADLMRMADDFDALVDQLRRELASAEVMP